MTPGSEPCSLCAEFSWGLIETVVRDQCVIDHMGEFPAIYGA
jgi:hypothetical protein